LNQVNDQHDDGNYEQKMDQTAANVADEAKKPEHDQDDNYSPKHGFPFGWVKLSSAYLSSGLSTRQAFSQLLPSLPQGFSGAGQQRRIGECGF
jgi:hypothetical protein